MQNTFDYLWRLLAPASTYDNKKDSCRALWNSFTLEQQRVIYAVLRNKKAQGEKIHPNPYFALEDNAYPEPDFLNGVQQDECWEQGIPLVMVEYKGRFPICTRATAELFQLKIHQEWIRIAS